MIKYKKMEETNHQNIPTQPSMNVPSKAKSSSAPWVVSIILIFAILSLGYFAWQLQKKNNDLTANLKNINDQTNSKEGLNEKNNSILKVVSPKGGDVFCLDQPNEISWNAPPELQTVVASLDTSVTFNRLGEFPAIQQTKNGVGIGKTMWNMKNEAGFEVPESEVYRISLSGNLNGQQLSTTSDQIFAVKKCQAQSDPLVYINTDYGFQITFPTGWENYKVDIDDKQVATTGSVYLHLLLPTTDKTYPVDILSSGEKLNGYVDVISITAWNKSEWDKEINSTECKTNPNPGCPFEGSKLDANAKYVFDISHGNGVFPNDIMGKVDSLFKKTGSETIGQSVANKLDFKLK
jgi:hypothetical protein